MNILVVDDEISILQLIKMNLELHNYKVNTSTCGNDAIESIIKEKPDIIILDAMLPDISGFELINKIKLISDIPIVMLTAKGDINDKLLGLQLGAEDYITKPFNSTELLLRIKVISKRINKHNENSNNSISLGKIKILINERKVLVDSKYIDLTFKEFEVLKMLMQK